MFAFRSQTAGPRLSSYQASTTLPQTACLRHLASGHKVDSRQQTRLCVVAAAGGKPRGVPDNSGRADARPRREPAASTQQGSPFPDVDRPTPVPRRAKPMERQSAVAAAAGENEGRARPLPSAGEKLLALFGDDPAGHRSGYVAIVGKPNAGKSTLLNALVGQKLAIVTPKPQTTRHRILGILSGPMHQAVLVDTPGIIAEQRTALDGAMMRNVRTALTQADVLLAIVDAQAAAADPAGALAGFELTGQEGGPPLALVLNKCDLLSQQGLEQLVAELAQMKGADAIMQTSALRGDGVSALEEWVVKRLPFGPTLYPKDQVSEHPERFFVAEIVREKIFEQYRQEIPYCTTVQVVEHKERAGAKDMIKVVISVERETQKGILIGRGGEALKQLMTASRESIEAFLERDVFIEVQVKVASGWRDDALQLGTFGIDEASKIY